MKIRLTILGILLVAVFIFAVGHKIYLGSVDFRQGMKKRYNGQTEEQELTI
ncbi:MAG: hypothetical protein PHG27_08535 [Massilibacteroides sp.]|nr:hypothetical protein [Massilibacteroides sp.]MDD3063235.1 hypothetical protein [Massilibacteroides sp.]MDD4115622.1 hypothetical protein [Massilibacteroides sp.]MDD4661161.1 hypothetical protein [Massilibacteroides sp.]